MTVFIPGGGSEIIWNLSSHKIKKAKYVESLIIRYVYTATKMSTNSVCLVFLGTKSAWNVSYMSAMCLKKNYENSWNIQRWEFCKQEQQKPLFS